jgi:hypothetical protein
MRTTDILLARYYNKDVDRTSLSIVDYRTPLELALKTIASMPKVTLDDIYAIMLVLKEHGIQLFLESPKYYCDKLEKNYRGAFAIGSGFFDLFKMKDMLIRLDRTNFTRDKFIELLRFFRYISDGVRDVTDVMIDDIVNQKNFYTDLKEITVDESPFPFVNKKLEEFAKNQKSLSQIIYGLVDSKAGISVSLGRKFTNTYGNVLQAIKITLKGQRGDAEFIVYVPTMIKGVYTLGHNKFIMNKIYEDYADGKSTNALRGLVRSIIEGTLTFTKAYKISQDNKEILRRSLQAALNGLMFAKRKIMPTHEQILTEVHMLGREYEEVKERLMANIYYFAPFIIIGNVESQSSPFETIVEHHKFYFKEYLDPGKFNGAEILNNLGGKGYDKHRNFPLNNSRLDLFDPGYMNNKADFAVAYLEEKKSLIEINPFNMHNHQSFRNAGSAYIIGHAFETVKPDKPLTITSKLVKYIPSYNMLYAMIDYVDANGLSTYDGQRLIHKHYADKLNLFEGVKIAFQGFDKGVSRVTMDDLYCVVNGIKYPINVASLINVASRKNFGVLFEGLYNAKKFFNGNTTQEVRDFYNKPLQSEELMDLVEIFNGEESLGKHPVVLMQSFLVRDIDSSYKNDDLEDTDIDDSTEQDSKTEFKSYKLGLEWFSRARLMGAYRIVEHLLGNEDKINKDLNKLESTAEGKLYGKYGKITQRFQKEVTGFTSTVTANVSLEPGQARIYLTELEFTAFLVNIKRIDRNYDIDKAFGAYKNNVPVLLPPALQLRNPSVDDANTIFTMVTVHKASEYAKHGYSEVNPIIWQRQGGDFDGDQVIFLFFPYRFKKELHTLFGYEQRNITSYGFEFNARDILLGKPQNIFDTTDLHTLPNKYPYTDLDSLILWIGEVKKNKSYAQELLTLSKTVQTKREVLIKASSNLMTTRISKQLIGVAKTITMKATFFIEDFMNRFNITDQATKDRLRLMADEMNYKLVQPTIDIQKWSDNLQEVVKTVLLVYRMSEAVAAFIEWGFYPTYRTFAITREFGIKSQIIEKHLFNINGETIQGYKFKGSTDTKLNAEKMPYDYQAFLYAKKDLSRFAEEKMNYTALKFDYSNAGWFNTSDPKSAVNNLIDVINPNGNTFKQILSFTEEDMKEFDAVSKFYIIK